jgi:anaerobic selenocysteine-containing dehydrogenase
MIQLGHALTALQPPVKALFVYNANPLSASPDGAAVRKGLAREDLFTVVHEQVMTPTALYADLLLPATTFLENRDVYTSYGHFYMSVAGPVIDPVGEARSNFDLFQKLAQKMGFDDPPFLQSCEERIEDFLQGMEGIPEGTAVQDILAGKVIRSTNGFVGARMSTKNGDRFHFVSEHTDPPSIARLSPAGEYEDPDLLSRFPFRLITPPHADLLNSTFGEQFPDKVGELLIHPEDASDYLIDDGEKVVVENFRGRTVRRARLTADTQRGLLVAEGIFWQTSDEATGINDLTSQKLTDLGRGATFHESLVSLVKI